MKRNTVIAACFIVLVLTAVAYPVRGVDLYVRAKKCHRSSPACQLSGVRIYLDGKYQGVTGDQGVKLIPSPSLGRHKVEAKKTGWTGDCRIIKVIDVDFQGVDLYLSKKSYRGSDGGTGGSDHSYSSQPNRRDGSSLLQLLLAVAIFLLGYLSNQGGNSPPHQPPQPGAESAFQSLLLVEAKDTTGHSEHIKVEITKPGQPGWIYHSPSGNFKLPIHEPGIFEIKATKPGYKPKVKRVSIKESGIKEKVILKLSPVAKSMSGGSEAGTEQNNHIQGESASGDPPSTDSPNPGFLASIGAFLSQVGSFIVSAFQWSIHLIGTILGAIWYGVYTVCGWIWLLIRFTFQLLAAIFIFIYRYWLIILALVIGASTVLFIWDVTHPNWRRSRARAGRRIRETRRRPHRPTRREIPEDLYSEDWIQELFDLGEG